MTRWLIAAIIGLMIAALHYGTVLRGPPNGQSPAAGRPVPGIDARLIAALLRALAASLVAAMLLGAPAAPALPRRPMVALDASASWTRGDRARARWTKALRLARQLAGGDSLWLFGDSLRPASTSSPLPDDRRSALGPLLDIARDEHRVLALVTDGESTAGAALPPGTRLTVLAAPSATDAAVAALSAPARVAPGDTLTVRATVRAGSEPLRDATLSISLGGANALTTRLGAIGAFAEHEVAVRVVAPRGEREELLRAVVATSGDVEPRNDTLATIVEITRVPSAVVISSSPDPDARAALEALSGALSAPPRGYYQVAPGAWRDANTLRAVSAAEVRAAAASAPLLVVHGDSMIFGSPSQLARSALVLLVPGETGDVEWRAAGGAAGTPLSASLAGIAWDSIPPIELPGASPRGDWVALEARSPGVATRAIVAGSETGGKRRLVVAAGGLWRWRARGGPARDAFDALWGAIADWTTSVAVDARPALPGKRWLRAEEPVGWIRSGADSVVALSLRRSGGFHGDTTPRRLTLRFTGDGRSVLTPALPAGRYTATMRGGSASFVVNAGTELLPTRATAYTVARGSAPGGVPARPLRDRWWAYVLAVAALCGEWIIRRRAGLR